ncbi:MAG: hypothetical protein V3V84_06795 [Candidatus Bathyarchaeia archaeon]|jgi:hypothetical protein
MNLKINVGITALVIGAMLIMYSAYNVNELLFLEGKALESDIPLYSSTVVFPILLGILFTIDGSIICGLSRRSSLIFHFLANIIWLLASYRLFLVLLEPLSSRLVFYKIFIFFMLAILLFSIGAIVNFLPKSNNS